MLKVCALCRFSRQERVNDSRLSLALLPHGLGHGIARNTEHNSLSSRFFILQSDNGHQLRQVMKLRRSVLKLKLKAGSLSKSNRQAALQEILKTNPNPNPKPTDVPATDNAPSGVLATKKDIPAWTTKPILASQRHATHRERRALRRYENASYPHQEPMFPTALALSTSPTSSDKLHAARSTV